MYVVRYIFLAYLARASLVVITEATETTTDNDGTVLATSSETLNNVTVNGTVEKIYKQYHCKYIEGVRIWNRTKEMKCCSYTRKKFYRRWYYGAKYLTTFMGTLKGWECPELEQECKLKTFDFTEFTSLVYSWACSPEKYRKQCFESVQKLQSPVKKQKRSLNEKNVDEISDTVWNGMVSGLRSTEMTDEEIAQPCTQVALFESERGGVGRFHEIIEVMIPFCGFIWCGYDADSIYGRQISAWTCLPQRCRIGMGVSMAIIACLGIATLMANITVLAVYCIKKRLNNSQAVYKATLAIGDAVVGCVVYPTFISSFYMLYLTPHTMGKIIESNLTANDSDLPPIREPNMHFAKVFSRSYLDAVGFFTSLSLVLSVYTLALASFDRMAAVSRPMSYNQRKARRISKYACAILLLFALFLAVLPIFTSTVRYGLVSSILVSLYGRNALIVYSVAFIVPLVVVWATTIILMIYSRKHTKIRRTLSSNSVGRGVSIERRLAKTLGIMVGVFSLTLLPSAVALICSFFLGDIYYSSPRSLVASSATKYVSTEFICVIILTSNSLWNCFIYSSRQPDFRKAARQLYSDASEKVGASALWRSVKRRVSERRHTITSIRTNSSTTALSMGNKGSTCSELERRNVKTTNSSAGADNFAYSNSTEFASREERSFPVSVETYRSKE